MPVEPVRERTMVALAKALTTIKAGSSVYLDTTVDYWTSPSMVTRALQWLPQYDQPLTAGVEETQLDRGPVLGVVRSSGSTFERVIHAPDSPVTEAYEHRQIVTVWGYVKECEGVCASDWLERLWQDVIVCLLVDPTLGGIARRVEPVGNLDTDNGAMDPLGWFAQDWLVIV